METLENVIYPKKAGKFAKQYDVKSFEVNANNAIKPFVLLHYLEDMAYIQAEELGFGYTTTYPEGFAWFVLRYHLKFERLPRAWEKFDVVTWPCQNKGIQARRDFEVYEESGKKIGAVSSFWVLLDVNTKRIVSPFKVLDMPEIPKEYAIETEFSKIDGIKRVDFEKEFEIRFDDIDMNRHVNNSNYIAWAAETLPYRFRLEHSIREMEIFYKKEAKYGMVIKSQIEYDSTSCTTLHFLKNRENDEELAVIKIIWAKESEIYQKTGT